MLQLEKQRHKMTYCSAFSPYQGCTSALISDWNQRMQGNAPAPAQDLDIATLLATFPPDVREEVLLTSDQTMLASLTPALLAEAQVLTE